MANTSILNHHYLKGQDVFPEKHTDFYSRFFHQRRVRSSAQECCNCRRRRIRSVQGLSRLRKQGLPGQLLHRLCPVDSLNAENAENAEKKPKLKELSAENAENAEKKLFKINSAVK